MNICSRMNPRQRARYGYKTFLTLTFAFIYQFMIQKAFKFTVKGTFGRNSSQKVFLDGQSCHNSLLHRPPFLSVFKTLFREAYQWLGTETSSVNGFNYLLPVGQIWWWLEVTQFLPYDWKSHKMWNIEWKCKIHDGEIKAYMKKSFGTAGSTCFMIHRYSIILLVIIGWGWEWSEELYRLALRVITCLGG